MQFANHLCPLIYHKQGISTIPLCGLVGPSYFTLLVLLQHQREVVNCGGEGKCDPERHQTLFLQLRAQS